jgi:HAD superfamily hydrolase (TIGR01549 family)
MTKKLKAILFDYDGTLRDSRSLIYASYEHAFKANGLPPPSKQAIDPHIHHGSFVHQALASEVASEDFEKEYRVKVAELMPSVSLFDGVRQLLQKLSQDGYKIGLVTAAKSPHEDLLRHGVADYFNVIVAAKDITNHKPHPEGISLAVERLGIAPDEAVYVGDMMTDMYAAKDAGLRAAIGITIGFANRRELETAGADFIIDDLQELPDLIARINKT